MSRVLTEEFGRGAEAFRRMRDATAEICETKALSDQDEFRHAVRVLPLDAALLVDARTSSVQYDRTAAHIAGSGMDHYQISLCLEGRMEYSSGRRTSVLQPGDLCLTDMAQASRTFVRADEGARASRVLTLVAPRNLLAPLLASPDGATASHIAGESFQGKLLAEHMSALFEARTGARHFAARIDLLAGLVADAVGSARDAKGIVDRARRHLLINSIKQYIDANLQTDLVGVEQICRRFQLSRATLYRLFEPDGGLWRYLQEQRLHRAFLRLARQSRGRPRVIDIAHESRFSSDATFVRAFRHRFGLTPGEVIRLAELGATQRLTAPEHQSLLWLRRLAHADPLPIRGEAGSENSGELKV